jgi:Tol biopolymer transport system component
MMSFALGQKGRCKMKLFKIPMFVMSLFGLGLLSGLDAPPVYADFTFDEPVNLGPIVNTSAGDAAPCISADGLSLFFTSNRVGGHGGWDIWVLTRETTGDPWGEPVNLGPLINGSLHESGPSLSADGLSLYFSALFPPGGYGSADILVTRRATRNSSWGTPVNLGPTVNSPAADYGPAISFDGLQLFFSDYAGALRPGGYGDRDIWFSTRATTNDPWSEPVNLGSTVNSSACDTHPAISADGLMLFFTSERSGGQGRDIWIARRTTADDDWGTPVNLGPMVNSPSREADPSISPDGRTLYFYSDRPGGYGNADLWQASVIPIVDFNGDGIVDGADMCIMADGWGTSTQLCDIGPTPLGNGVVDYEDLAVFAEYWLKDFRLIAHWKLDETEGTIAHDSAGDNDAFLAGPVWQPAGGKVDGALQFNGPYDIVSVPFVLNPEDGSFSAFAWIKGGKPGQVIISQTDGTFQGSTWLCTDPLDGKLTTKLSHPPFSPLESESIITDDQWHHIGLVYDIDALHRHLYVDGAEVAKDTNPAAGLPADGGLYFGAGKDLDAGSFFSGLIDDVCIYNQALSAEEIEEMAR